MIAPWEGLALNASLVCDLDRAFVSLEAFLNI